VFASQLAQLPLLTELFVTKGYTQGGGEVPLAPQEGSPTFERFLHSLKKLEGLRVLRVAAINDDVSLSRSVMDPIRPPSVLDSCDFGGSSPGCIVGAR